MSELILRNLEEVLWNNKVDEKSFEERLKSPFNIYWGTAPTGQIHIGYLVPFLKIKDFVNAGCGVVIFIADVHAELDALKTSPDLVTFRTEYYIMVIKSVLQSLGVNIDNIVFTLGSDIQNTPEYTKALYHLMAKTSEHNAKKAGTDVVKQSKNPSIGSVIYPLMQALDEVFLTYKGAPVDAQLGGVDQRKIFTFAKDNLDKIGKNECIHFMNPMVTSPDGNKMSASDERQTKILFTDTDDVLQRKINKMFCVPKQDNQILHFLKMLMLSEEYEVLSTDFFNDIIGPKEIKSKLYTILNSITTIVKSNVSELISKAYPQ